MISFLIKTYNIIHKYFYSCLSEITYRIISKDDSLYYSDTMPHCEQLLFKLGSANLVAQCN
jgi:hypothetical protein